MRARYISRTKVAPRKLITSLAFLRTFFYLKTTDLRPFWCKMVLSEIMAIKGDKKGRIR